VSLVSEALKKAEREAAARDARAKGQPAPFESPLQPYRSRYAGGRNRSLVAALALVAGAAAIAIALLLLRPTGEESSSSKEKSRGIDGRLSRRRRPCPQPTERRAGTKRVSRPFATTTVVGNPISPDRDPRRARLRRLRVAKTRVGRTCGDAERHRADGADAHHPPSTENHAFNRHRRRRASASRQRRNQRLPASAGQTDIQRLRRLSCAVSSSPTARSSSSEASSTPRRRRSPS
jgi:hypothetical protein